MKLGKKKDADASVDEKPAKKAVKKAVNSFFQEHQKIWRLASRWSWSLRG